MSTDGVPLPSALSGTVVKRLIEIDEALLYLVAGTLVDLLDRWQLEQTGTLTVEQARDALSEMYYCFAGECFVPEIPIGSIQMWPVDTPPDKWLLCDGSAVSRLEYAFLFDLIGEAYGVGNGTTTFNLPNFYQRSPVGAGGLFDVGNLTGNGAHTLTVAQLPAHNHREKASTGVNASVFTSGGGGNTTIATAATLGSSPLNTNDTGGGSPFSLYHPVIVMQFIIYAGV